MSKAKPELEALLEKVMTQMQTLDGKVTALQQQTELCQQQLRQVLANQGTFYGRLLVTRKNLLELHDGQRPSLTQNEAKELEDAIHPPLAQDPLALPRRRSH